MTNQDIINLVTAVYLWFNQISDPTISFQKTDLEQYFTPTFIMEMNDKIITWDYLSLYDHFEEFRKSGDTFHVNLPLQEVVISDDKKKCIVKYTIDKQAHNGKRYSIKVIAIWHLSLDGRLDRMNEVVHFEEQRD